MNYRAEYLLQVLEKIGSPLMASIIEVNARNGAGGGQLHNEAQKIAELLAKTVQASIDMSHSLDLGPLGEMSDSVRIALTGLASPLVAGTFRNSGKSPGDNDIKKLVTALQAVLTFAENFEANVENTDRLKNAPADGQSVDAAQKYVQHIHAFVPVVTAVSAFSFGQPEQKLIMEIGRRLVQSAADLRQSILGDLGADNTRAELGMLKGLAQIYASAHEAETKRLGSADRAQMEDSSQTMAGIWKNFDVRVAMLQALAKGIAAPATKSAGGASGMRPEPQATAAPQPAAAPPPAAPPSFVPPSVQPMPEAPPTGTPLSVFAKKPTDAPPPATMTPSPPPTAPPVQPPTGNPMAFFKPPPQDGDS